jgi:hypothetical protein
MLSDIDLVREFVKNSIQKQEILLANSTFKAQTVSRSNQLIAKTEGVILTSQVINTQINFLVNARSSSWELMNQILAEYCYILISDIDSRGFYQYQYCEPPKGYQMHCTKSVMLWRSWWKYRKFATRPGIPLELLIRTRESWYPIRDLIISDGLVYIKTLGTEIAVHSDDLIIWLSKINE